LATQKIRIPGTEVIGFPLFEVLDGKTSSDYEQRVEPSTTGGMKMADKLMDTILIPTDSKCAVPMALAPSCSNCADMCD